MKKDDLLKLCKLYKGELKITDNPIKKSEDEFKWQMWRVEYVAVHEALNRKVSTDELDDFIKAQIKNGIDTFASVPFGGDPKPYYDKYFNY